MPKTIKENKHFTQYIISIVFIVFIFGMAVLFLLLPKAKYSSNEKRYLADAPQVSMQNLASGQLTKDMEGYLTDHIPFREFYVGANAYYNLYTGRNGSNGVYSGSDGYLINDPVERENNIERNIKVFADFVNENNIDTTLMIVPSTGYVMDSKLPLLHKNYLDDSLFAVINNTRGSMKLADLRESFKKAAAQGTQLYYKTDHHWTSKGAFLAYNEYCMAKGLQATTQGEYYIEIYDKFYGTTYSTSALWLNPSENIELWQSVRLGDVSVEITEDTSTTSSNSMFYKKHLTEDDKYPVFLDGNHALTRIKNSNAPQDKKLLVIKDSYAHCMVPFLTDNYGEILMVDLRYYKDKVSDFIKNEGFNEALILYGLDNLATDTNVAFLE